MKKLPNKTLIVKDISSENVLYLKNKKKNSTGGDWTHGEWVKLQTNALVTGPAGLL